MNRFSGNLDGVDKSGKGKKAKYTKGSKRKLSTPEELKKIQDIIPREINFDPELPFSDHVEEIGKALESNQVIIVIGPTGSGKSTQLPKACLSLGRGIEGRILCTQPRRTAAITLAQRVSDEMERPCGELVGYSVRYDRNIAPLTRIEFATDGYILARMKSDPLFLEYDTIILDEIHERSLNPDCLMGYLCGVLEKRPRLRVILSSATPDLAPLLKHFRLRPDPPRNRFLYSPDGQIEAPVISISGKRYPVDLYYLKEEDEANELSENILKTVSEIYSFSEEGHILVFLPGRQEIAEVAEILSRRTFPMTEIIPFYSGVAGSVIAKVFRPSGARKIILSTNIAETSLTIPDVHYVIDSGLARVSRYNVRNRILRLGIEKITADSANQRMGRAGRTAEGICFRMYTESDFLNRPASIEPEIIRNDLSEMILRLKNLGIRRIDSIRFPEPPRASHVSAAEKALEEIGAIDKSGRITPRGRKISRFPMHPRMAALIMEGMERKTVYPVIIAAGLLSAGNPIDRGAGNESMIKGKLKKFADKESDVMTFLNIWNSLADKDGYLPGTNRLKKFAKSHYLNFARLRDWKYAVEGIRDICKSMGYKIYPPDNIDREQLHDALLAVYMFGLAARINRNLYKLWNGKEVRPDRFSQIYNGRSDLIMCLEMVETSGNFASVSVNVRADKAIRIGGAHMKKFYGEPFWDNEKMAVMIHKDTYWGEIPLRLKQPLYCKKVDPEKANETFIRQALVEEKLDCPMPFWEHNKKLRAQVMKWENKLRYQGLLKSDRDIYNFYASKLHGMGSRYDMEKFINLNGGDAFLKFELNDILTRPIEREIDDCPDTIVLGGCGCRVTYIFNPASPMDGACIEIPLEITDLIGEELLEFGPPGIMKQKIEYCLRALPKTIRAKLQPMASSISDITTDMTELFRALNSEQHDHYDIALGFCGLLEDMLERRLGEKVKIPSETLDQMPPHLNLYVKVLKNSSKVVKEGRYKKGLFAGLPKSVDWSKLTAFHSRKLENPLGFDKLFDRVRVNAETEIPIFGFMGLAPIESEKTVYHLRPFKNFTDAALSSMSVMKLLAEEYLSHEVTWLENKVHFNTAEIKVFLEAYNPGLLAELNLKENFNQEIAPAVRHCNEIIRSNMLQSVHDMACSDPVLISGSGETARQRLDAYDRSFRDRSESLERVLPRIFNSALQFRNYLDGVGPDFKYHDVLSEYLADYRSEILMGLPFAAFDRLPLYFRALIKRGEKLAEGYPANAEKELLYSDYSTLYKNMIRSAEGVERYYLMIFRMMLLEWCISLFAQELGTAFPLSQKRIDKFVADCCYFESDPLLQRLAAGDPPKVPINPLH